MNDAKDRIQLFAMNHFGIFLGIFFYHLIKQTLQGQNQGSELNGGLK